MSQQRVERYQGAFERMGLTALGFPPFVTFLGANLVSNASWFIFGAALNTYILAITGSAQDVGVASFVYSLPFALFMLHAGLLAGRFGSFLGFSVGRILGGIVAGVLLAVLYVGGGIGGLIAGMAAEPLMRRVGHGRTIFVGMGLIGAGLIGVGLSGAIGLTAVAAGVAQGGFAIYGSSSLSLVQSLSPPLLRGRVTSLFTLLYWGLLPFGALAGGLIAERTSALVAVILAGCVVISCGIVLFVVRPQIATLRIDRAAGTVSGRLDGSGYPRPSEA